METTLRQAFFEQELPEVFVSIRASEEHAIRYDNAALPANFKQPDHFLYEQEFCLCGARVSLSLISFLSMLSLKGGFARITVNSSSQLYWLGACQ
jgi:hypothetical protein